MEHRTLTVFATDERGTLAALQHAKALAPTSGVQVLAPWVVEYGAPLIVPNAGGRRIEASVRDLAGRVGLEAGIRVCACRDPRHVSGRFMLAPTRIVVGGRWRGWRATAEQQLARELACEGHDVVFVDVETGLARALSRVHA